MPEPKRPLKVFLCHSSQDKPIVKVIYDRLLSEGWIDPWLDKERLKLGDDFDLEIEKAIESTDAVIAFISENAVKKTGYIQKELRLVYDAQMYRPDGELFTIPLRLEECEPPRRFKYWHWGDYFGEEKEKTYQSLLNSLSIIYERVQREETVEQARLEAEKEESQRLAKEKANREATEKAAREKAENEANENVRLEPIKVTSRWNALGRMVLVSVWSSSEEAGRQIFIANLAAQAALTGMRVGLADTDFALPTAQSMFGLDKPDTLKTINDYLYGRATIGEVGLPIHESNGQTSELKDTHIWLFPASVNPGEFLRIQREGIDIGLLRDGFRDAYEKFNLDCLFINLPSNVNEETLLGIAISNVAIIVVRPDNLDYARTAAMIDTARKFEIPNVFLAVNNVLPKYDKYDVTEVKSRLEQTYDTPVLGMLPLFDDIVDDGNAGMFSINSPSHKWSRGLCSLAQSLFETKI